ncbi:MAG: restriction endonuclease subunit S [Acinetobacter junii]
MSTALNMEYQKVKFGEIAKHISKRVEPSETTLEIYVGLEHLDPDSLKITRHGVPSDVAGQKLLVKKGQIIFGKRRAYQRKVAVADWDCICSAHAMVLEAIPGKILPEFLPFFMQSNQFMERAVDISEGSLSPTIKWKILETQKFIIPTVEIQQNILIEIDKLNTILEGYAQQKNLLENIKSSLYWDVFNRQLGLQDFAMHPTKFVSNTEIVLLQDILSKLQNGYFSPKEEVKEATHNFINVVDCYVNPLIEDNNFEKIYCSEKDANNYYVEYGDILFNRSSLVSSGIGWPFLITPSMNDYIYDCHLIKARLNTEKIIPEYLYIYCMSPWARKYFKCVGQTTTMTTISQSDVGELPIVLPHIKIQEKIVSTFAKVYALEKQMIENEISNKSLYTKLLDSMSG